MKMERVLFTFALISASVFTVVSSGFAAGDAHNKLPLIEVSSYSGGSSSVINLGIDPIITGPRSSIQPVGIMHQLDACDADCQADRLGLKFD